MKKIDPRAATRRGVLRTGMIGAASAGLYLAGGRPAWADDTLADVKKRGELVIATEMEFPPFDFLGQRPIPASTAT